MIDTIVDGTEYACAPNDDTCTIILKTGERGVDRTYRCPTIDSCIYCHILCLEVNACRDTVIEGESCDLLYIYSDGTGNGKIRSEFKL